jgi:predicted enzyme involved in methoxymalonyl-ACP biosynthesis
LTGVLVAFHESDRVRIDTWLVSCRVLGRKIEDAMLASVCAYARAVGARAVTGEYIATAKNAQVQALFPRFGFHTLQDSPERALYELPIENAPRSPAGLFEIDDATLQAAVATGERTR